MRFLECLYPYQAHLCEIVDCGGDLYRVAVYHPAYGHHESAVLQDARSGPRGILLQHGSDRTAGHEHEEQRQNDKPDHSRTKTLWFSRLHGRSWMIALFPLRGSTSSRGAGVRRLPSISGVRPAWLRWGEKSFSAVVSTHLAHSDQPDSPDGGAPWRHPPSAGRGTLVQVVLYFRVATFKDSEGNDVQLYEPPK